jgi:hypothetical protein
MQSSRQGEECADQKSLLKCDSFDTALEQHIEDDEWLSSDVLDHESTCRKELINCNFNAQYRLNQCAGLMLTCPDIPHGKLT